VSTQYIQLQYSIECLWMQVQTLAAVSIYGKMCSRRTRSLSRESGRYVPQDSRTAQMRITKPLAKTMAACIAHVLSPTMRCRPKQL
jgi:hypothetical protein